MYNNNMNYTIRKFIQSRIFQRIHIHTPKKMKVSGLHAFVAGTFDLTGFRAAMAAWSGVRFLGESFQLGRVVDLS